MLVQKGRRPILHHLPAILLADAVASDESTSTAVSYIPRQAEGQWLLHGGYIGLAGGVTLTTADMTV